MGQAAQLDTLGDLPLTVVTAMRGHEASWFPMQDDLLDLSTNSTQVEVADATHETLLTNEDTAAQRATPSPRSSKPSVPARRSRTKVAEMKTATITALSPRCDRARRIGVRELRARQPTTCRPPRRPTTATLDDHHRRAPQPTHRRARPRSAAAACTSDCVGAGPTTVLLIAGWGDGGDELGRRPPHDRRARPGLHLRQVRYRHRDDRQTRPDVRNPSRRPARPARPGRRTGALRCRSATPSVAQKP